METIIGIFVGALCVIGGMLFFMGTVFFYLWCSEVFCSFPHGTKKKQNKNNKQRKETK